MEKLKSRKSKTKIKIELIKIMNDLIDLDAQLQVVEW